MSGMIAVLALLAGLLLGAGLIALTHPRQWYPGLRRWRRRLLGAAWRPVLMQPYVPPRDPS